MMKLGAVLLIASLVYAVIFVGPFKLKIFKKHGKYLSNAELLDLASKGDADAKKLKKITRYCLFIGFVSVFIHILEKYKFINF